MAEDLKPLLLRAKETIVRLRRQNELLGAQVQVVDLFRAALLGPPPGPGGLEPDVAWEIDRAVERAIAQEKRNAADADKTQAAYVGVASGARPFVEARD